VRRFSESRYINSCSILKMYNKNVYKLITIKCNIKVSGYEEKEDNCKTREKNGEKIKESIIRTRSKILEYALCNDFEYFVTLTLDAKKMERDNIEKFIKKLGQYIRDLRKHTGQNIEYLLIPERHKDGENWHMHGLVKGLRDLRKYDISENIPKKMKDKIIQYREHNLNLYEWKGYTEKFGFNCIEPVRNKIAVSRYVTKYISKNIDGDMGVTEKNKKKYYCSRGLKTAKNIKKGVINIESIEYDFENDYCKVKWLNAEQAKEIEKLFYC